MTAFFKKQIAFILIVSIFGLIITPALFQTKTAQAGCPVTITGDEDTGLKTAWKGMDKAFQSQNLAEMAIQTSKMVWDKAQKLAEWAIGQALNVLLHQILATLTNDIVNWIQNGEEPRFLSEGLDGFLGRAVDNAAGHFLDQYLGMGFLCDEFDAKIKLSLLDVPDFETEAECKLSEMDTFFNSFTGENKGDGWNDWIKVNTGGTNVYGAYLLAQQEEMKYKARAQKEIEKDLEMGNGFLSPKNCTWTGPNLSSSITQSNVVGVPSLPDACKTNGPCDYTCEKTTPGSIVNHAAGKVTTNYMDKINNMIGAAAEKAGPFSIYVQAITTALVNKVMTGGVGLLHGNDTSSPDYGDTGEFEGIPNITTVEEAESSKDEAEIVITNLETLEDELENNLLTEQQTNLSVLNNILSVRESTIPILNQIQTFGGCTYVSWATGKKTTINSDFIPDLNNRISNIESNITETEALVGIGSSASVPTDTPQAISSMQNFINKVNDYIEVYEEVGGDEDSPELETAQTEMNNALTPAISDTKDVIINIEGSSVASSLEEVGQDVNLAFNTVIETALSLYQERGLADYPAAGTLYAELESAKNLKQKANNRLDYCESMTFMP